VANGVSALVTDRCQAQRSRPDGRGRARTIDLDGVEVRDVDEQTAVTEHCAAPGMTSAPDSQAKPVSAGEVDGRDDVANTRDSHDDIGAPLRRELVPHQRTACRLVVGIVTADHPSFDGSRQASKVHRPAASHAVCQSCPRPSSTGKTGGVARRVGIGNL